MTPNQLTILKHSWGYDHKRRAGYRSQYCGELDDKNLMSLVEQGMMVGPKYVGRVVEGCGLFFLTEKAIAHLFGMKVIELTEQLKTNGKTKRWLTLRVNEIKRAMEECAH